MVIVSPPDQRAPGRLSLYCPIPSATTVNDGEIPCTVIVPAATSLVCRENGTCSRTQGPMASMQRGATGLGSSRKTPLKLVVAGEGPPAPRVTESATAP